MARTIVLYYDVNEDVLRDSDGNALNSNQYPFIYYKERPMVHLLLVTDSALTPYTALSDGDDASVVIDADYNDVTDPYCDTDDALINVVGEWKSGGDADKSAGEFSIPLDADNSAFDDAVGASYQIKTTQLELQIWDSSDLQAVFWIPFFIKNLMDRGGVSPEPAGSYYNRTESDARFINEVGGAVEDNIATWNNGGEVKDSGVPIASGTIPISAGDPNPLPNPGMWYDSNANNALMVSLDGITAYGVSIQ